MIFYQKLNNTMKFVLSQYFLGKIKYLRKHFPKIEADFKDFETNFLLEE
jgi:hypothetical protein